MEKEIRLNKKLVFFVFLGVLLISLAFISSLDNGQGDAIENQAEICLNNSGAIIVNLALENFSVIRVNDSFIQARDIFEAQTILKRENRNYDFSLVLPYCDEVKSLEQKAFEARDEFLALEKFYSESSVEGMDNQSISKLISEIKDEIYSERYEKVHVLVEKTYEEIVRVQGDYLSSKVFYRVVTNNLKEFFYKNWVSFFFGLIFLFILFIIYKNTLFQFLIKRKMAKLKERREILKDLIRDTQKEYFAQGNISERTYKIKIQKFAEFIRDIDRQVPLLNERLLKVLKHRNIQKIVSKEGNKKPIKKRGKKNKGSSFGHFFTFWKASKENVKRRQEKKFKKERDRKEKMLNKKEQEANFIQKKIKKAEATKGFKLSLSRKKIKKSNKSSRSSQGKR